MKCFGGENLAGKFCLDLPSWCSELTPQIWVLTSKPSELTLRHTQPLSALLALPAPATDPGRLALGSVGGRANKLRRTLEPQWPRYVIIACIDIYLSI